MPRPMVLMNGEKKICEELLGAKQHSLLSVYSHLSHERRRRAGALVKVEKALQSNEYDSALAKGNSKDVLLVRAKKLRTLKRDRRALEKERDAQKRRLAELDSDLCRIRRAVKEVYALEARFGCDDLVASCAKAVAKVEALGRREDA